MKQIKTHLPCRLCGSSDAAAIYENPENKSRFYKCFSCEKAYAVEGSKTKEYQTDYDFKKVSEPVVETGFTSKYRGLTLDTLKTYGVTKDVEGNVVFPYHTYDKELASQKIKGANKTFTVKHLIQQGFQQSGLFGHQSFASSGGKYITVTEGEEDAMSVFQMQGSKYPCVSLKSGGTSTLTQDDYKYLDGFDNIIFCADNDAPGKKAAQKFASSFPKSKVKIVSLSKYKDANDYLQAIEGHEANGEKVQADQVFNLFLREWWNSSPYVPEGLVQGRNTLELFLDDADRKSIPYPWAGLNEFLHGIRTSELICVTAGTGVGKTAVLRELMHHIFKAAPNEKIGCIFLEEPLRRTVKDLVGIELGINLRLPENVVPAEKRTEAWKVVFDNDRFLFMDHFGSNNIENICNQIRFMATNFGARYVFLDHISIIVSDQSQGDERKALDAIMTKLATLAQEVDIAIFLVSHLRRPSGSESHEEGSTTSLSQLRGSAGIGQLAHIVLGLERNGQAENRIERNVTIVRVLKDRNTGETGPACKLLWEKQKGRLKEVTDQEIETLIAQAEELKVLDEKGETNEKI